MEPSKIFEVLDNAENKSNKDILNALKELETEFNKTKELIISLTYHLEKVEELHNKGLEEINKRLKKS